MAPPPCWPPAAERDRVFPFGPPLLCAAMAEAGQTVELRQNGVRLTYLASADDTDGKLLRMEMVLEPGGVAPALHVHPRQEERLAVRGGTIGWHIDDSEEVAQPGEL